MKNIDALNFMLNSLGSQRATAANDNGSFVVLPIRFAILAREMQTLRGQL